MQLRRLFHTSPSHRTSPPKSRSRSSLSDGSTCKIPRGPPSTNDVFCPTCSRPTPPLLLDSAVETPLYSVASHDATTQLLLTEFFIGCIYSNDPLDRQVSPPQPADIATLCSPCSASCASDCHAGTTAPRVSPQPPPGLEKYAHLCASHGILVEVAASFVYIHLCYAPAATCKYHPSGKTSCAFSSYLHKEYKYRPSGNPQSHWCRPSCGKWSFFKPRALVLPMVKFVQAKPDGLGRTDTRLHASSIPSLCSSVESRPGAQEPHQYRCAQLVEGSMRLFLKKPVIMSTTSPISSLRTMATRTLLSCSTRTPLSPTLWFVHSGKTPQAKVLVVWSY